MDAQLSKKQKKAQAFRAGKGKKKEEAQLEVPDGEDLDVAEEERAPEPSTSDLTKETTKKRKRDKEETAEVPVADKEEVKADEVKEGEGERKKKRQRGKKKSEQRAAALEEGKSRLVLFVGNLPFKITVSDIQEHFKPCGETPIVRILTAKPSPTATAIALSKTKGCAFIEFTSPLALQAALRLHEEELQGRKLNIELTAGGGGKSAGRTAKLEGKRQTLTDERARTKKNKAEREGVEPIEDGDKSNRWKKTPVVEEEKLNKAGRKVRDRRLTKGGEEKEKERQRKTALWASSGANSVALG